MATSFNITDKLSRITDWWRPYTVAHVNDCAIKLVKFRGHFVWHKHEHEDELFLVLSGSFTMRFRDYSIDLERGDVIVVPRGVDHMPVAEEEVHVLLVEPLTTINTGDANDSRKVDGEQWL
jgi:mannose-6-phosphate isomerase-like protein (cupin superfamily)